METDPKSKPLHETLNTSFVNLWSLLRSLSQKGFIGRVRVDLRDYSADVFMDGSSPPMVREIDRKAGTETLEEGALHRLVLRTRETPGTITLFEGANEAKFERTVTPFVSSNSAGNVPKISPAAAEIVQRPEAQSSNGSPKDAFRVANRGESSRSLSEDIYPTGSYRDWPAILATTGELIAAVERGVNSAGENFTSIFRNACLQLADDYNFLDPTSKRFEYSNGAARLNQEVSVTVYVSGLSEALRRAVDSVAVGERARRTRERVAIEMLTVARKREEVMERSGLRALLDRIAGTRVM